MMSAAVITVTLMTVAVIPLHSGREQMAAQRTRPPGAGGAGALRRAGFRPGDRRRDRRTGGSDGTDVLPTLRRQAGGAVRGTGHLDGAGDDAHRRRTRVRLTDRRG